MLSLLKIWLPAPKDVRIFLYNNGIDHSSCRRGVFSFLGIVLIALAHTLFCAARANTFVQCLTDIRSSKWGTTGGTDNNGYPVADISTATAVTYELCKRACGVGADSAIWTRFAQQFSSWLLPWLALISQLPFGAKLRSENFTSMLLAVGSPMLAAYSLALTILNGVWLARRFGPYKYPNVRNAVRVLGNLQQAPLKITTDGLLASLVVLEENDPWWEELATSLEYTHIWSISAATSIGWVILAYIFTVIDAFFNIPDHADSEGQGIGLAWLWLLPVVIGWLQLSPKCDSDRLTFAMDKANKIAHVATDDGAVLAGEQSALRAFSLQRYQLDTIHLDEENTAPIFNYARFLPWLQAVEQVVSAFHYAAENAKHHRPVNPDLVWENGRKNSEILPANRTGSLEQVENYCREPEYVRRSRWGPDVVSRVLVASLLSLMLQWGTAAAAIVVVWYTPTRGLGCSSGSYVLYALTSTVIWALMVLSSAMAHYATIPPHQQQHAQFDASTSGAALASVALRRVGKLLAALNAIWIVVTCLLQLMGIFNSCYCNSSVLGLGSKAYTVIIFNQGDMQSLTGAWIAGVLLAVGCASGYVGFVNMYIDPPLPE